MLNSRNEGLENVSYEKWKYPVDPRLGFLKRCGMIGSAMSVTAASVIFVQVADDGDEVDEVRRCRLTTSC